MKRFVSALLLLLTVSSAFAQGGRERLFNPLARVAGVYHSYESDSAAAYSRTPAPEGYAPFYISHYGRHGSRWLGSDRYYTEVGDILNKAYADGALTPAGETLSVLVDSIRRDAAGMAGELTPRGVREQRGIAERMYKSYPEVFENGGNIESRSTQVIRCVLTMAAFDERLKELNPLLNVTRESSKRNLWYIGRFVSRDTVRKEMLHILDSVRVAALHPDRFIQSVFSSPEWVEENVEDPAAFYTGVFNLASNMEDVDYLGIDLFPYFTEEELYECHYVSNINMYLYCGDSERFGEAARRDSRPLIRNIVETADRVIADGSQAATLRFGHDTNITPLEMTMGLESDGVSVRVDDLSEVSNKWLAGVISPMGANLQIIFYRNASSDVIIKILRNEKEAGLPIGTDIWPYYRWDDAKAWLLSR